MHVEAGPSGWPARVGERFRTRPRGGRLPPGPPLPPLTQLVLWARRPLWLLHGCRALYGDTFTLRFPNVGTILSVSDPEHVKEVFTGPSEILHAGVANRGLLPVLGDASLLLLDGPRHMRDRRLLLPPFHGERITRYGEVMRDIAARRAASWTSPPPVRVLPEMQAITLDIILRTVFGLDEGEHMDGMRVAIHEVTRAFTNPAIMIPQLHVDAGPRSPWGRFVRARAALDELLYAQITRRRGDGQGRDDVLTLLLSARDEAGEAMSDRELRDELVTLLLAGHETTATALAWSLFPLSTHCDALDRAQREVDAASSGGELDPSAQLPWIDAVVKEAMRIQPVVSAVARVLQEPMRIAGFDLAAGTMVAPSIYLTHHNPRAWKDPERFDPERFVDTRISPYAYLPFGGGVRRCIGMAFASYEARVILGQILTRRTPRAVPGLRIVPEKRNVTMAPSQGTPLLMLRR